MPCHNAPTHLQRTPHGRSRLFADIAVDDDLEAWLEDHSYIGGFTATQRDAELFDQSALQQDGLSCSPALFGTYSTPVLRAYV